MDPYRILFFFFFFSLRCHGRKAAAVQGNQFAKGSIEVSGLSLREHFTFTKISTTTTPYNATFFSPSSLPPNFFPLGSHLHLHTSINPSPHRAIIARNISSSLAAPTDFTLLFSTNSSFFFWLPIPPPGHSALGHLLTTSPQKPPLSSLRCLPNHLLEPCKHALPIFSATHNPPFSLRISNPLGTFILGSTKLPLLCLKQNAIVRAAMPNLAQITTLIQTYSPRFHFHPQEPYLPSSVSWFFHNGALLYTNSTPNSPTRINPLGANLPQGGTNDGAYWLDLPADAPSQALVKSGNLSSAEAYIHVKPMHGGTTTDIVFWLFYPFNGPAKAKVEFVDISLGRIGEHVGDWEHVTLRFSNFDGELKKMYFSQHSSGEWVDVAELEYEVGERRPAAYAALHGHAFYPRAGLVLVGEVEKRVGIRDETAGGGAAMGVATSGSVVAGEYLGVEEPVWLQYMREWGPKVNYDVDKELEKVMRVLPGRMKRGLRNLVSRLPKEVMGEEGPTGPKCKGSWDGDEL